MAGKRRPKPNKSMPGSLDYTKDIIKCLERIGSLSGHRPSVIFDDWTIVVETTLERLPEHIKAVAQTGQFAPDTAEVAELVAQIQARYCYHGEDRLAAVWAEFGRAFALLLEGAAPGLWAFDPSTSLRTGDSSGYMGPDIIGHTYMTYANSDPGWSAQYFTPWNVALMMAMMNIGENGKAQTHQRLKEALCHKDNVLGAAVLLAGMIIDDPREAHDWFLNRVIPAALPYYDPITVGDPCVGSGVMLLAAATQYEPWMVQLNLVQFFGQDIDPTCVRMCRINSMLYGLNAYALRLAAAVAEATGSAQGDEPPPSLPPLSAEEALKAAKNAHQQANGEGPPVTEPTFEQLFRKQPVEEAID